MKKRVFRQRLAIPYALFLLVFVILPLFVVLYYAFTNGQGQFSVQNFLDFFTNGRTMGTLVYSLGIAVTTTVVCLLIAYPLAYFLSKSGWKRGGVLLMLFILPMWINFTLRVTALKEILTVIEGNMAYYPFLNTIIGMVYDFLPYMVLPLYQALEKIDHSYEEAAADLGAPRWQVVLRVILPLSLPGIVSGVTMVLLPAMTNYVVLDMVYNSTYIMGSLIGSYFNAYDWHNGSVVSIVLLGIIVLGTYLSDRTQKTEERREAKQ